MDKKGKTFEIQRGASQGTLSRPSLFGCVLKEVFRKLSWRGKGIGINGEILNNLRFADDVVIISSSLEELEEFTKELVENSKKVGLEINLEISNILTNSKEQIENWK